MKKNHLFLSRTNANKHKIRRAQFIVGMAAFLLLAIVSMITASTPDHFFGFLGSAGSVAFLAPLVANVKGTLAANGFEESDADFAARKGAAEDPPAFHARCIKYLEDKINAIEKVSAEIPELKKYQDLLEGLKSTVESMKKDSTLLENLKKEVEKANLSIEAMRESGNAGKSGNDWKEKIAKEIAEKHEDIKKIFKQKSGVIEFKVVANVTTASGSNPDDIPEAVGGQIAPPGNVNLRGSIVDSLVTTIPTTLSAFPYTDTLPKDGDFTAVAEGSAKPQMDFEWKTRYAEPSKIAAWIRLTDEAVHDVPQLQAIANDLLRKKHDLKKQNLILFGDGISPNPLGATEYARAFSADGLANGVTAPNFMDVVNAGITDIYTTHNFTDEMPYMANLVMINPVDFFLNLSSAKDGFGHPLYPAATLFNRVVIGGVTIIAEESIPAGKIFIADMGKYNTTNFEGYTVKIGFINDDFIKNQFVILAESRFHAFVKELDQQAFIYDDIATILAAIEKL